MPLIYRGILFIIYLFGSNIKSILSFIGMAVVIVIAVYMVAVFAGFVLSFFNPEITANMTEPTTNQTTEQTTEQTPTPTQTATATTARLTANTNYSNNYTNTYTRQTYNYGYGNSQNRGYSNYYTAMNYMEQQSWKIAAVHFSATISEGFAPVPMYNVYVYRGMCYAEAKNYQGAVKDFTTAINYAPNDNATAYLERGKARYHLFEYQDAIYDINSSMAQNPNNGDAYYYLGLIYTALNDNTTARRNFQRAVDLAPDNADYRQEIRRQNEQTLKLNAEKYTGPVYIKTCNRKHLFSIDGFNEEKVERFLEERTFGKLWYDIDTFAQDFDLQPHEIILAQDRIVFPPKPKVQSGRKIDKK